MIRFVVELQALECTHCEEMVEVSRRVLRDPDAFVETKYAMKDDHRECRAWPGEPGRGAQEREFLLRVRKARAEVGKHER